MKPAAPAFAPAAASACGAAGGAFDDGQQHGNAALGDAQRGLEDLDLLVGLERGGLAQRAADDEAVDARIELQARSSAPSRRCRGGRRR